MSADKTEARRLADALQFVPLAVAKTAAAMLRRWPDGEPVAWLYEARYIDTAWTVCVGLNNPGPEGAYLRGVRPLYTAPPAERIAALEEDSAIQREAFHMMRDRADYLEAALTERDKVIEQARVAMEGLLRGCKRSTIQGLTGWHEKSMPSSEALDAGQDALRAIEEVRK